MFFFVIVSFFLFALGAVIGSFLNVLIYRTLDEEPVKLRESWVTGRSRCDHCKKQISWYDNVPLVSFLILRGRCRHCHQPITTTHLVVELLVGALLVWWFWGGSLFFQLTQQPLQILQPLFWLFVGILLVVIALADLRYWIIPDWAVWLLSVITIAYRLVLVSIGVMRPVDLAATIIATVGGVLFFASLWLITKKRGIGLGDVKLMLPLGLLVGWPNILVTIFLAFLMGSVVGVGLILGKKRTLHQAVPFGPFLVVASCVSLVSGDYIVQWYLTLLK